MAAHVVEAEDDGCVPGGSTTAGVGMVPVVGSTGVLVLLMSAASVEGLRRVAQAWTGPVLLVSSADEAREIISPEGAEPVEADTRAQRPAPSGAAGGATTGAGASVLQLDEDRQMVRHAGGEAALTPLEFGLLSALLHPPGRVRRFEQLTEEVWGTPHIGDAAPVHSVVKRLRRKLEVLRAPVQLQAVRGIGFRLAERPTLSVVES